MKRFSRFSAISLALMATAALATPAAAVTGPYLVEDIKSPGSSSPDDLTAMGGILFFSASGGGKGRELWRSDGTESGTRRVKDIKPGGGGSGPTHLAAFAGLLYFGANDGVHGRELWVTDGTGLGTHLVRDINPGADSSTPFGFTGFNGAVYFSADNGVKGQELWKTDGTASGTRQVKDIEPGPGGSHPSTLVAFAGKLIFLRTDCPTAAPPPGEGACLYKSDGTASGTKPFRDYRGNLVRGFITSLKVIGGKLFFIRDESEVWRSNGGSSTLRSLGNFGPWSELVGSAGNAFFNVGSELWKSSGTTAGTVKVADTGGISRMFDVSGTLFFTDGYTLYKSDGTEAGTVEVDPGQQEANYFVEAAALGSTLYYTGPSSTGEGSCLNDASTLWQSDGTPGGTFEISATPSHCSLGFSGLMPVGGSLFFATPDGVHGTELWRYVP
jgi:ELWxxDGT repeat protein